MNLLNLPYLDFVQAMTSLMEPDYRSRRQTPVTEDRRPATRRR